MLRPPRHRLFQGSTGRAHQSRAVWIEDDESATRHDEEPFNSAKTCIVPGFDWTLPGPLKEAIRRQLTRRIAAGCCFEIPMDIYLFDHL